MQERDRVSRRVTMIVRAFGPQSRGESYTQPVGLGWYDTGLWP